MNEIEIDTNCPVCGSTRYPDVYDEDLCITGDDQLVLRTLSCQCRDCEVCWTIGLEYHLVSATVYNDNE